MIRNAFAEFRKSSEKIITSSVPWRLGLGLVLALCCAGIVLGVRAYNVSRAEALTPLSVTAVKPIGAAQIKRQAGKAPRFVRFNLYDVGIIPREIHVTQGLLAIAIEDYSGGTSGLVIEREIGSAPQQVGTVGRNAQQVRGKTEITLDPGNYQVYMADHPDNRALLVVEP